MKQSKLFGSDEQIKVLNCLELAKAEALANQVEETIKPYAMTQNRRKHQTKKTNKWRLRFCG